MATEQERRTAEVVELGKQRLALQLTPELAETHRGEVVMIDVDTGEVEALLTQSAGLLYARVATRWATPGKRLAKIAGTSLARTGKLLSA